MLTIHGITGSRRRTSEPYGADSWQPGAPCVVISGSLDDPGMVPIYAAEVPEARLITCRLVAGLEQLTERVLGSASSQGPGIPNQLKGKSEDELRSVARQAYEAQQRAELARVAELCVDTTDLLVPDVASAVTSQIREWPQPAEGTRQTGGSARRIGTLRS